MSAREVAVGRCRFVPEAVQVLLTEEVTGSLRQLKVSSPATQLPSWGDGSVDF